MRIQHAINLPLSALLLSTRQWKNVARKFSTHYGTAKTKSETLLLCRRGFSSSTLSTQWKPTLVYEGGLTKAAKIMKIASVASLVGASAAVPFFFTGDSEVPSTARAVLAATTIAMTGSSTLMVTWALKPYITSLYAFEDTTAKPQDHNSEDAELTILPSTPLVVETLTFLARPRTRLMFPEQLAPATAPMTSWTVRSLPEPLMATANAVLEHINKDRKKSDQVQLAQEGDTFYAHTQGPISAAMQKIIAASPCQE
ncbi:hypothetical protein BX070DRAFT_226200 [Coemansia spiralis]|nr:hypothetical protein BX070DRAFT_226200 [Coemansia spiralis]